IIEMGFLLIVAVAWAALVAQQVIARYIGMPDKLYERFIQSNEKAIVESNIEANEVIPVIGGLITRVTEARDQRRTQGQGEFSVEEVLQGLRVSSRPRESDFCHGEDREHRRDI